MSNTQIRVSLAELKVGMYVSELDRAWLETPYLIQGFLIESQEDIDQLMKYCEFVYVDASQSVSHDDSPGMPVTDIPQRASSAQHASLTDIQQKEILLDEKPKQYSKTSKFPDELKTAYIEHAALSDAIKGIIEQTAQNNKLDLAMIEKAVVPMVDSVIRNPDAFAWLTMMKERDNYAYNHSISTAIWAAAFGRNLGLPIEEIKSVSMGALLFDIGKVKLPKELVVNSKEYNPVEHKIFKKHVDYSLEIVKSIDGIKGSIIDMVATHHERHDGSGYPNGLKGDSIPLFGKMAGIIDCYDAIISDRYHARAISPHDAVKKLYDWSNSEFQSELIEQFIQVVGVYPVGTLVELSDGRVGVVVAQHEVRRLRPKVMLILDRDRQLLSKFKIIDLYYEVQGQDGASLDIVKTVNPRSYGIDPAQFYI